MRQAAQHNAVKNTVNWMGLSPSLTAAIQAAKNAACAGKPEGFTYAASAKIAG